MKAEGGGGGGGGGGGRGGGSRCTQSSVILLSECALNNQVSLTASFFSSVVHKLFSDPRSACYHGQDESYVCFTDAATARR